MHSLTNQNGPESKTPLRTREQGSAADLAPGKFTPYGRSATNTMRVAFFAIKNDSLQQHAPVTRVPGMGRQTSKTNGIFRNQPKSCSIYSQQPTTYKKEQLERQLKVRQRRHKASAPPDTTLTLSSISYTCLKTARSECSTRTAYKWAPGYFFQACTPPQPPKKHLSTIYRLLSSFSTAAQVPEQKPK